MGVVEVGGRVWGEDIGEEGEVVRVYGDAERVEGILDLHDREVERAIEGLLRVAW